MMTKKFSFILMMFFIFPLICLNTVSGESPIEKALREQKEKMEELRQEQSSFLEPNFEQRMQEQQVQRQRALVKESKRASEELVKTKKGLKRVFGVSEQINGFYSIINNPSEIEAVGADNFVNNLRRIVLYIGGRPPENSPQKITYLWREMISLLKLAIQNINANKIPVLEPKQKELEGLLKILEKDYSLADHFTNLQLYLDEAKEIPDSALLIQLVELLTNEAIELKKKGQLAMLEGIVKSTLEKILTMRNLFSDAERQKTSELLDKLEQTKFVSEVEVEKVESADAKAMVDMEIGKGYPDPGYAQKFALVEQLIAKGYQGDAKLDSKEIQALIDALRFLVDNISIATLTQREILYNTASFLSELERTSEASDTQKKELKDLAKKSKEPVSFIARINYMSGKFGEVKDFDPNSINRFVRDVIKLAEEFVEAKIKGEKPEGQDALIKLLENILNNPAFAIYKLSIQPWIDKIKGAKPEVKKEEVKPVEVKPSVEVVTSQAKPVAVKPEATPAARPTKDVKVYKKVISRRR